MAGKGQVLSSTPTPKGMFYGWWIVRAGAVLAVLSGTGYYGFGVFFNPIRQEFGWTAALLAGAFSIQRLEGGIAAPLVGWAIDRYGPRPVGLFGATTAGLGFILMSRISSVWSFYFTFLIASLSINCGGSPIINAAVANWFSRRRGRALAITHTGFGFAGFVAPLLAFLIARYTWRETLVLVGIAWWLVGVPLCLTLRHKPEQYGYLPDGDKPGHSEDSTHEANVKTPAKIQPQEVNFTPRQALRTRAFWLLTGSSLLISSGIGSVFSLMIPVLESYGISRATAALSVSLLSLVTLVGRWGFGLAADVVSPRYILALTTTFYFIGLLIFANINSAWMIIPFVMFFSMGFGGDVVVRSVLQARYFGRKAFATIQGLMNMTTTAGGVMAPVLVGWAFDTYGSYRSAFLVVSVFVMMAVPMFLAARSPAETQKRHEPEKFHAS